jgi:FixJ family two-component response regulator
MPGMSGLELQERLSAEGLAIPVIVITGFGDAQMAVRALKGGAIDFLEKPFTDQHLLERVNEALERDRKRRAKIAEQAEFEARVARLTTRERQVLDFVVEGKPNKIIASELSLSPKTVEVHRSRMMDKMGVGTLAQLLRLVITYRGASIPSRTVN